MNNIYLFPGHFVVSVEPAEVTTILGSCVAVALHDPSRRITALNHYLLPQPGGTEGASSLRYAGVSLPRMLEEILSQGAALDRLQAKVYGGARVIDNIGLGDSIGRTNVDFALAWLKERRIPVLANDLGGNVGRKIIVNTQDFSVKHQLMNRSGSVDTSGGQSTLIDRVAKVVVVDDSATVRSIFSRVLTQSGKVEVVGVARDAFEAREVIVEKNPDVVLLDIEMPGMSGVKFLEKLMQHFPLPTLMVSSLRPDDDATLRALELGALEFVHKPAQFDPNALRFFAESLVQKVVAAASQLERVKSGRFKRPASTSAVRPSAGRLSEGLNLVLVGGNGGAHQDLEVLLQSLPHDTPPVLVSVSSVSALLSSYIEKWKKLTRLDLKVASDGVCPMRGTVYFAPAGQHLMLESSVGQLVMRLSSTAPVCLQLPSADVLFQSALKAVAPGQHGGVVGILMSGLGQDGVQGLLQLHERKAQTFVTHPEASSFAFAPQAAISVGAAEHILRPEEFATRLMSLRSKAAV
ncbi:MAG: response regulator [Betaproteobacteria bacterium]|nr:response regulator [Betaproteobacteria bacterium]